MRVDDTKMHAGLIQAKGFPIRNMQGRQWSPTQKLTDPDTQGGKVGQPEDQEAALKLHAVVHDRADGHAADRRHADLCQPVGWLRAIVGAELMRACWKLGCYPDALTLKARLLLSPSSILAVR
jgi:hypothetical protein